MPLDEPQADVMLVTTVIDVLLYQDALAATARILNYLGLSWTLRSADAEADQWPTHIESVVELVARQLPP